METQYTKSPPVSLESDPENEVTRESNQSESVLSKPETLPDLFSEILPIKLIGEHWNDRRTILPIEFFTVWDLAGQSYLFCMHSLFLIPRAVYLLPVDLSVGLDAPVVQRGREGGRVERRETPAKTHLDIVTYWIRTIYSVARCNADQEPLSRIIVVFTKSDLVDDALEKANLYFQTIKDSLTQNTNCMSIVETEFQIVSAKEREQGNLEKLRQIIHKNAEVAQFNFPLPIRWLDFALKIYSQSSPVLGKTEMERIANETACAKDYVEILQLFHSIGVFFFRRNILVKSLPNLLDIILHIVAPQYCTNLISDQSDIIQDIKNAAQNAVLSNNLLDLILSQNNLVEVKPEIARLLEEFGVILYGHGDPLQYYIPYLFTGELSTIYDSQPNDLVLYLYFPDDQVPTSFYFAFISLCIGEINNSDSVPTLAFDCMKFQCKDNITWIIDFSQHQPYIRIIFQGIDFLHSSPDIGDKIFRIEDWISQIQHESILFGRTAAIVLDCPCDSMRQKLSPCVYFESYQTCSANDTHFYCKSKQKYFLWSCFNKHIKPFRNISPKLGQDFLDKHQADIVATLDSKQFQIASYKSDLITGDEFRAIQKLEKCEKACFLCQKMSSKGKEWVNKFYGVLKSENGSEIRTLFESFIIQSLHSDVPVPEDRGFTPYPFHHNPCGICLIVNFENFDNKPAREGANFDSAKLRKTFEKMNFLIHLHKNLTRHELFSILKEIRSKDHSNFDLFFCIIMSHGDENDDIYTTDDCPIGKEEIFDLFRADNCPSLAQKPKVFVVQACRGGSEDKGYINADDIMPKFQKPELCSTDARHTEYSPLSKVAKKVPVHADFFIAQSTVKGHVAYRSRKEGSVFINIFCSVLDSARYSQHLGDIMTEVRRQVGEINIGKYVQCPEAIDRLTKKLFLS